MTSKCLFALSFLGSLCAAGCGGGGGGGTTTESPTITSVSVSCTSASIQTGQTSQCSATVSGTGSYSSGVTWSATDGTVTSVGVFTPSAAGTATVTATSTEDSTKSGSAIVTVSLPKTTPTVTVTPAYPDISAAQVLPVTVVVNGGTGNPTPTGSVTLTSGSYTSAATILTGGSASIGIVAGSLATGSDTLKASYTPDSSSSSLYNPATGTSSTVTVAAAPACNSTLLGDVNGDGVLTDADAQMILDWDSGAIPVLTCPALADANQDGIVNGWDAAAFEERVAGTDQHLLVSLEGGLAGKVYLGGIVTIAVSEDFFPFYVKSGTVRIQSASTGYDSGDQTLNYQIDGRSLYWHWPTAGLKPATDYQVSVSLNQTDILAAFTGAKAKPLVSTSSSTNPTPLTGTVPLTLRAYEPVVLSQSVDASAPAPGIPLSFTRSWSQDSYSTPVPGPFGLGWMHSFEIRLNEFTDGSIAFVASGGVDRVFTANGGGVYTASPGDYGVLTLGANGFQLREKNGFIYSFNSNLQLGSVQDRNGNTITCGYDDSDNLISLTHSSGAAFQLAYNSLGLISTLTDQNGRKTQYTYDPAGTHLATVTTPDGEVTSYSYASGLGFAVDDRLQVVAYPDGTHLTIGYNSTSGQVASTQRDGGASELTYTYPANGQTNITDAGGGVTSILVTQNLRPVQVTDPLGDVTTYQYDANFNLVGTTDPLKRTQTFSYDNYGNLITSVDAAGNQSSMTYDSTFNQLTSFQDARGNVTKFVLDSLGNVTSQSYPDGSSQSYAYGASGLPTSHTDAKGQKTLYTYTSSGQLSSITYPDGSTANYAYNAEGDLTSAADSTGTILLAYDIGNRLISKTYPGSRELQYEYDAGGRRIQMTDADGVATNYTYDNAGRLSQITNSTGQAIATYQYDAVGRVNQKTLANGAYAKYAYDLASHVQKITNYASSGSTISFFGYTYDAGGNVLSKNTIEGLESYAYDPLGQLTGVTYPKGAPASYSYDAAGNRTSASENGVPASYTTNNLNQYQSVGAASFSYDLDGNMTGQSPAPANVSNSLTYDFNNRLTQARTSSASISYTYNALGERSSRTDSTGTVQYLWDGLELAMEQTSGDQTIAKYTWGRMLDEAVSMTRSGSSYYYTQDALRSVSDLLNVAGGVAEHYTYTAYGTPSQTSTIGNPWMFTGARFDPGSSLYSLRVRWYSPVIGRFVTEDPIGLLGGANEYNYAGNKSTKFTDPIGLLMEPPSCAPDCLTPPPTTPDPCPQGSWACDNPTNTLPPPVNIPITPINPQPSPPPLFPVWFCSGDSCSETPVPSIFWGGLCPTFIQLDRDSIRSDQSKIPNPALFGKIALPVDRALLRSDIPIYGVAGGTNFKEYRVEFGEGKNPSKWSLIQTSTTPQPTNKVGLAEIQLMQGDMDLRGNLATWNTGLKEWVHLPWHPADDPTDFRGEYTIRLVVTGTDGKTVEDRVHAEVGRVIAQVLPGEAISTDNKVTMHFEAQSIQAPFRVYTIKPLVNDLPSAPAGMKMVGPAYTIREPGDQFLKPVILRFDVAGKTLGRDLAEFGIYAYDAKAHQWLPLPTTHGSQPNALETSIIMLPEPVTYFAVLHGSGSRSALKAQVAVPVAKAPVNSDDPILVSIRLRTAWVNGQPATAPLAEQSRATRRRLRMAPTALRSLIRMSAGTLPSPLSPRRSGRTPTQW